MEELARDNVEVVRRLDLTQDLRLVVSVDNPIANGEIVGSGNPVVLGGIEHVRQGKVVVVEGKNVACIVQKRDRRLVKCTAEANSGTQQREQGTDR